MRTARELLDTLHARCPVKDCPACELNARVEKVLTDCEFHAVNELPQHARRYVLGLLNGEPRYIERGNGEDA